LGLARSLVAHGLVDLNQIITHRVNFYNPDDVRGVFEDHGKGSRLKTVILLDKS
jgi:threonine dehydrogenase-like Zn-dependent dehydrogenase